MAPATPDKVGVVAVPEESGDTHEEIARQKAAEWSRAASMLAISSDGGLVIPALGEMWESRNTRRFAGPAADNHQRRERLLQLMAPHSGEDRRASWVEAVAIARKGRVLASWHVAGATGVITESASAESTVPEFWAFTVWYFSEFAKTYDRLTHTQRDSLDDHWIHLSRLVRRYFLSFFVAPQN